MCEVGDFFQAADLAVLVLFDGLDKDGRVDKALMVSGIKPGKALAEEFHMEAAFLQVDAGKVCDLVFSAGCRYTPAMSSFFTNRPPQQAVAVDRIRFQHSG